MSNNVQSIFEQIKGLSLMDAADLVKLMEEEFGAARVAEASGPAAGPVEEKTEFEVILSAVGDKKLEVIKVVREVTNLGLKEAKDLVESTDVKVIKAGVKKDEAASIKSKLEAVGAKVDIK